MHSVAFAPQAFSSRLSQGRVAAFFTGALVVVVAAGGGVGVTGCTFGLGVVVAGGCWACTPVTPKVTAKPSTRRLAAKLAFFTEHPPEIIRARESRCQSYSTIHGRTMVIFHASFCLASFGLRERAVPPRVSMQ